MPQSFDQMFPGFDRASLGVGGTQVRGADGQMYTIAPHYKDNTFYGDGGPVDMGGQGPLDRYTVTKAGGTNADAYWGTDLYNADGSYNMHAAYQGDAGAAMLVPIAAAAGGAFAFAGEAGGGAAVSGMDMAADTPGALGSYAGGVAPSAAITPTAVSGGSQAVPEVAAGGGGATGGAGMQWGTGAGGEMTAADYERYARLGASAYGMFSANGGGGGGGGGGQQYVPTGLGAADQGWQQNFGASGDLARRADGAAWGYDASFGRQNGLDWSPYLQRSQQAGDAYGAVGDAAMGQMGEYGRDAQASRDQQGRMYGAAGRVLDTAFDPQHALYDRTAQHLTDQVRAGQAARGLGNSEAGAMEEAGAMRDFNIDWENAQLGRQATGIQAADGATGAGVNAGRMAGADMSAGLQAGAAGADYYGRAGAVPMDARRTWAAAPGQATGDLVAGYGAVQQMHGNAMSGAIPYMNFGNGAIQGNYDNTYRNNRDMVSGMSQFGSALAPTVGPMVKDWFSGGGAGTPDMSGWPTNGNGAYDVAGATFNNPSAYSPY